ncbi:MAG: two-component system OmpR family alkaline phosphatase synthesis response regulator PhoP [Candidatus Saganbacteria bacterium]|uniref:Two-component system OmpR family alkaline phosphatase synthesis response regulator PhoP n=1 Tax=Candidatus Saganbacteria bacterium TaxID=2575572 RepID=A0A833KZV0_UNCSA|nr:MAG: two-component system OmpR family alkaline phosphatase synthesis response regulator PhoP [Candidatus Saganbacteria bacterium]
MARILIIEDEKDIAGALEYNFKKEKHETSVAYDGIQGLKLAQGYSPSLIILDIMLPGMDGLEICRKIKSNPKTEGIPIIILTAKSEEVDKIVGLELGADDYITKPFSMKELLARVKTILRRSEKKQIAAPDILKFDDLEIDSEKHQVSVLGKAVDLTAKEFQLLKYLAENKERVFSRDRLLDSVWGINVAIETRTVDVHVRRLREKLGKASRHIKTLRGVGYKFNV